MPSKTDPIGFSPSEATIRLQVALEANLQSELTRTQETPTHQLKLKDIQTRTNLPLIGVLKQWVHSLVGDVLRWSVERDLARDEEEPVIGIPAEDAESMITTLEVISNDLTALLDVLKGNKGGKEAKRKSDEIVKRCRRQLAEVATMIDDYALEEVEDLDIAPSLLFEDEEVDSEDETEEDSIFEEEATPEAEEVVNV